MRLQKVTDWYDSIFFFLSISFASSNWSEFLPDIDYGSRSSTDCVSGATLRVYSNLQRVTSVNIEERWILDSVLLMVAISRPPHSAIYSDDFYIIYWFIYRRNIVAFITFGFIPCPLSRIRLSFPISRNFARRVSPGQLMPTGRRFQFPSNSAFRVDWAPSDSSSLEKHSCDR